MGIVVEGVVQAFRLLLGGDPEVWRITLLSLQVSGLATLSSLAVGVPVGTALALARFPGRGLVVSVVNTGMGLPPVVVGLFVTILLWRSGVLGGLELLYTPFAMILAQFVIAVPIVTGLTLAAVQQIPERFRLQMLALGASRRQLTWVLMREARLPMLAAVMAGFGGVISEVGASMMVGGNIRELDPRAHHRHRARDGQGQLRHRHCPVADPARHHLPGELGSHVDPAAPPPGVTAARRGQGSSAGRMWIAPRCIESCQWRSRSISRIS